MQKQNITYVTPDQLGYKDRGIKKWQGLILGEQAEALKKLKNEVTEVAPKEEMTEEEISRLLHKAYAANYPILIQANIMRNGGYYKDLECKVAGSNNGEVYLKLRDGRNTKCTIDQIRNVELMDPIRWYNKME